MNRIKLEELMNSELINSNLKYLKFKLIYLMVQKELLIN